MTPSIPTRPSAAQRPYTAYNAAAAFWRCRDLEVCLEGPAGTGKTRACLEKVYFCAMKYPGMRTLIVRKTRESMTESVLVTFEDHVVPEGAPVLNGPQRSMRQRYALPNGSVLVIGGLVASGKDQSAKVMSTEYDLIYVPEATELNEAEYDQLLSRLRNGVMPYQQCITDCNPGPPTHWLHRRCDAGTCTVFFSRHEDNPRYYDHARRDWTPAGRQYIFGVLEQLSGVRKERLRYGRRAAAEGAVYAFDRDVHLIDTLPVGHEAWRRVLSIDFGYTNPLVAQDWAIDGDGRMWLVRELYYSQRVVADPNGSGNDHATQLKAWCAATWYEAIVTDHDAEDRATLERALHRETTPACKAITTGIQAVDARLRVAGDGKPRLVLKRDAVVERDPRLDLAKKPWSTEQEFDGYIWPIGGDQKPTKEVPVDINNHGMDAMRYAVAYVDGLRDDEHLPSHVVMPQFASIPRQVRPRR